MSTSHVEIVMATHVNGIHRLFGGQLMSWIDIVGAVEARRWSKSDVTTVTVDHLTFLKPAYENDTIVLEAKLTWTGHTSMEVKVCTYVEKLNGEKTLVNKAFLVYVAIDSNGEKVGVPEFIPETEEEKFEYSFAKLRKANRLGSN